MAKPTWTEERVEILTTGLAQSGTVTQDEVKAKADVLEVSSRSVSAKLRKLGYDVEKVENVPSKKWSDEEESELRAFVESNPGQYTYAEIAASVLDGKYPTKSVQGKILSMELHGSVKPTEKQVVARTYTPEQEEVFVAMAAQGASIEAIAEALGKTIESVRGKSLSLSRSVEGFVIPKQSTSHAQVKVDPWADLSVADMTVEQIAETLGKSERGVKTALTRRELTCLNYDGAAKAAKAAEKRAAE